MSESFQFRSARDKRVFERLKLLGEGPPQMFEDACRLLANPDRLKSSSHLVGHLLREVESAIRSVISGLVDATSPRVEEPSTGGSLRQKKRDEEARHRAQILRVLALLGISADDDSAGEWLEIADRNSSRGLSRKAHRDNLRRPRPVDSRFANDCDALIGVFDVVLDRFEAMYATVYQILDTLVAKPEPRDHDLQQLSKTLPATDATLGYFFGRLEHTAWFIPLLGEGYFSLPSPPDVDEKNRRVRFPKWPQTIYLAKVAPFFPVEVAGLICRLASTKNVAVQADLVGLAVNLPPLQLEEVTQTVLDWTMELSSFYWGDGVVRFAASLAERGDPTASARFILPLCGVQEDPGGSDVARQATPLRREYEVPMHARELEKQLVPALCRKAPEVALEALTDVLGRYVGKVPEGKEVVGGAWDYSPYWAPEVTWSSSVEQLSDLRHALAVLVAQTTASGFALKTLTLPTAMQVLAKGDQGIFRRLELKCAAQAAEVRTEGWELAATELLANPGLIAEDDFDVEWVELLRAAYKGLNATQQVGILSAIRDQSDRIVRSNPTHGEARAGRWRRDRLEVIRRDLDGEWAGDLHNLVETYGTAEEVRRFGPRIATWNVPASPVTDEELSNWSLPQVVRYLGEWKGGTKYEGPSQEGLARSVANAATLRPSEFALGAEVFVGLPAIYVEAVIGGLLKAKRDGKSFEWRAVLNLARWVVHQDASERGESDPWRGARKEIADLLGLGFESSEGGIALAERTQAWEIVAILIEDPDPTPEHEERYGGTNMEPSMLALNTTRPEAVDAAIRYSMWAVGEDWVGKGLGRSPEVADALLRRLDPEIDESVAVRAAVGKLLGALVLLDEAWVVKNVALLFPKNDALWGGMWEGFVCWGVQSPAALRVFAQQYREAIAGRGRGEHERARRLVGERTAEHLMKHCWWGDCAIGEEGGLLEYFFSSAALSERVHAIRFAGFSLYHSEKPVAAQPLALLRDLWDWRMAMLTAATARGGVDAEEAKAEMREYGWWAAARAFPQAWTLTRLEEVLSYTGGVDPVSEVLTFLGEAADAFPREVVACLKAFDLAGGNEPWRISIWLDEAKSALLTVLRGGNENGKREAIELINRFVAAGHTTMRDLLTNE